MNMSLEEQNIALNKENAKLKEQIEIKNRELDKLEHVLLANLAHKEQEIADLSAQIEDMKSSLNPCNQQLRCMGLDPAVNVVFLRIKKEMKAVNEKFEQTQNDLQAWKFTPDSQTGKRMMTRMRVLLQENEELGKMNQSGRTAKLESEIAMKKTLIEELKQTNCEYENVIEEMDTETECFQTTICLLQQQLMIARTTISKLSHELDMFKRGRSEEIIKETKWASSSASSITPDIPSTTSDNKNEINGTPSVNKRIKLENTFDHNTATSTSTTTSSSSATTLTTTHTNHSHSDLRNVINKQHHLTNTNNPINKSANINKKLTSN